LASFIETYADQVNMSAQQQQSRLRGATMATGFNNFTNWVDSTSTAMTNSGDWRTLGVDVACDTPVKLTPIQEIRAGLKSWLG